MKCCQSTCDKEATHTVYWPGKTPPPVYCDEDTQKAKAILAAMGTPGAHHDHRGTI